MKKLLVASTIALGLSSAFTPSANAATYSQSPDIKKEEKSNEMIGFGSGALAGAAVAGPIGAFVGGIFGLLVANDINNDKQLKDATLALADAKQQSTVQQQNIIALQDNLQKMQHQQMIQLAAFDEQSNNILLEELVNFETHLQFKTASFLVEDLYKGQLNSLASVLTNYPQLKIKVSGYADERGDSQYNKILSEQRAMAVKQYLLDNKVNADQIDISAEGETALTSKNTSSENKRTSSSIEDLFFARKVHISVIKPTQQMTAAN